MSIARHYVDGWGEGKLNPVKIQPDSSLVGKPVANLTSKTRICSFDTWRVTVSMVVSTMRIANRSVVRVGGVTVSMVAFQAVDPGSTPGRRISFLFSPTFSAIHINSYFWPNSYCCPTCMRS